MRVFLAAAVTAFVIAGISSVVLEAFQASSDRANTTSGARVDFAKDGVSRKIAQ